MKIDATDYYLSRFCQATPRLLCWVGKLETSVLASKLAAVPIERPVFICGLARAGTTMLLELLSRVDRVATHRYRDFPFVTIPYLWNKYADRVAAAQTPVERPHKDRIWITRESPESMEEPLWIAWFPHLHSPTASQRLGSETTNPRFEQFHASHLRKMLLIRQAERYVAKNNYHVTRIEYLARLYPDAEFIVPVRDPLAQVESLANQHRTFCDYARQEPRLGRYLQAAGHFEFGPQRRPICIEHSETARIIDSWNRGEEHVGYAIQWKQVYGLVRDLTQARCDLSARIHLLRYEDFCETPDTAFAHLIQRLGFEDAANLGTISLQHISKSMRATRPTSHQRQLIWNEVGQVAEQFGYRN